MNFATADDDLFLRLQQAVAGRYSLERELGRDGMGIVFLARGPRDFATGCSTKLAWPPASPTPISCRFMPSRRRESSSSTRCYVAGETLGERSRRQGALEPHDAARVVRDTAYALAYAHAQGVIHRDVKPDNILLEADGNRAQVRCRSRRSKHRAWD